MTNTSIHRRVSIEFDKEIKELIKRYQKEFGIEIDSYAKATKIYLKERGVYK